MIQSGISPASAARFIYLLRGGRDKSSFKYLFNHIITSPTLNSPSLLNSSIFMYHLLHTFFRLEILEGFEVPFPFPSPSFPSPFLSRSLLFSLFLFLCLFLPFLLFPFLTPFLSPLPLPPSFFPSSPSTTGRFSFPFSSPLPLTSSSFPSLPFPFLFRSLSLCSLPSPPLPLPPSRTKKQPKIVSQIPKGKCYW